MCISPLTALKFEDGSIKLVKSIILKNLIWKNKKGEDFKKNIILLKCGKCHECKKIKIAEMIKRITKEASFWKNNIVATLTFNEKNKKETFEQVNKEAQKFLKRIRKKYKIRYFEAIEKGEQTERLHIHIIIFNYLPEDEEFYKKSKKGTNQYFSKELNKLWGLGIATHEKLNKKSINYCVKYLMKNKEKAEYHWSKKPPLGISENENLEKIKSDIENGKLLPKSYKNYTERKLDKKIKITPIIKEKIEQIEEERIRQIEKQSKMNYKEYLQNRFLHLTKK